MSHNYPLQTGSDTRKQFVRDIFTCFVAVSWHRRGTWGPRAPWAPLAPRAGASCPGCPGWGSCCWWRRRCCYSCWWTWKTRPWTPRNRENASPAGQVSDPRGTGQTGPRGLCVPFLFSLLTRSSFTTVSSSSSFPLSQGWKYLKPCRKKVAKNDKTRFDHTNATGALADL